MARLAWIAVASFVAAGGCEGGAEPAEPTEPAVATGDQDTGSLGVVEGVVRLAEGALIPSYTLDEVGRTAERPEMPENCPPPQEGDLDAFRRAEGGGLVGLMIGATGDRETFFGALPEERPPSQRALAIRGCRLEPSTIVATRGDSLVITNRDEYPFLPKVGQTPFIQTLLPQRHQTTELSRGGVVPVTCGFAAPCGRAEVIVLYHPVHTVTDERGHFRIENVPADQDVELYAWHPSFRGKLERATVTVNVGAGETERVEFVIEPVAAAEPAPGVEAQATEAAPEHEGSAPSAEPDPG